MLSFFSCCAFAQEVGLAGILGKKAILVVDGENPKSFGVGEKIRGYRLMNVGEKEVVLEKNGRKITLRVGQNASSAKPAKADSPSITLFADPRGQYSVAGQIEGHQVDFVLDTGASDVALPESLAKQLNLDYANGEVRFYDTANGRTTGKKIVLKRLILGGVIELNDVEASVAPGTSLFKPLLGTSALRRLNMNQTGNSITLSAP